MSHHRDPRALPRQWTAYFRGSSAEAAIPTSDAGRSPHLTQSAEHASVCTVAAEPALTNGQLWRPERVLMTSPDPGQRAEYDVSPQALSPITDLPPPTDEYAARRRSVVIADDCRLFRENLATVLAMRGIDVHRLVWDLPSLVVALQAAEIGVIVLLNMAIRGVGLWVRAALEIKSDVRIIVLGASEDADSDIIACAEAGVAAYHMRTDSLDELISVIDDVAAGQTSCPPEISAALLRRFSALGAQKPSAPRELVLTTRETQILRMLELGRSNREIARYLDISVHTVKNHVHSLLTKLGVSTRVEAAALARTIRTDGGSPRRSRSRTS